MGDGRRLEGLVDGGSREAAFWRDRGVLVTGATGLLGSAVVRALARRGARVVALVRDRVAGAPFWNEDATACTVVQADLSRLEALARVLAEYEVGVVFHLAAQTQVPTAFRDPVGTFEANIRGTWHVLEAMRRSEGMVSAAVVASSDKAYGPAVRLPYDETHPLDGRAPYDVSKACTAQLARCYALSYGIPAGITFNANLYGPGDLNWARLVPGTIRSILRGERPVLRSNGRLRRDYLYVDDAAEGAVALAVRLAEDPGFHGRAMNFSSGENRSVLEVVECIAKEMGSACEPIVLDAARGEIEEQALCSGRAREELGWRPGHDFEAGIRRTVRWYRRFLEGR